MEGDLPAKAYAPRMSQQIDIGGILSRVLQYYREQAGVLLPAAVIVFVPVALAAGALRSSGSVLAALAGSAVQLVGNGFYAATVVEAVRDIQDGRRDFSIGQLFSSAFAVVGPVIIVSFLAGLGIVAGFILLVVPGLILLTIWAAVIPITVLEKPGITEAFGRSRELVRGNGWPVFGVLVILFLVQFVASLILVGIFAGIGDFAGAVIGSLIASVLVAPLNAIAATVLYLELSRIKAGAAPTPTAAAPPPPPPGQPPPPPPAG